MFSPIGILLWQLSNPRGDDHNALKKLGISNQGFSLVLDYRAMLLEYDQ